MIHLPSEHGWWSPSLLAILLTMRGSTTTASQGEDVLFKMYSAFWETGFSACWFRYNKNRTMWWAWWWPASPCTIWCAWGMLPLIWKGNTWSVGRSSEHVGSWHRHRRQQRHQGSQEAETVSKALLQLSCWLYSLAGRTHLRGTMTDILLVDIDQWLHSCYTEVTISSECLIDKSVH